jgi:hypothetical protein
VLQLPLDGTQCERSPEERHIERGRVESYLNHDD